MQPHFTRYTFARATQCLSLEDIVLPPRSHSPQSQRVREILAQGNHIEPLTTIVQLPFTGIDYLLLENGLIEKTLRTFGLFRLQRIRQLGFLTDPVVTEHGAPGLALQFDHTRYGHILDTMVIMALIARNNRLSPELQNTACVAALCHDALTPAGGDSTKLIDPAAFDEDAHFGELLAHTDWATLQNEYIVDQTALVNAVQGQGILGTLLDLADKIAYVARDLGYYLARFRLGGPTGYPDSYFRVARLVEQDQYICGIWDAVRVVGNRVVITDTERLAQFLRLRALMFRVLYYHQGARFLEFMFAKVIVQYLYETGKLTRTALLEMDDYELEKVIDEFVNRRYAIMNISTVGDPHVEVFRSAEAAYARETELISRGIVLTLGEDLSRVPTAGTHFLVRTRHGRILPLAKADPQAAAEIEAIARVEEPFRLYYLPNVQDFLTPRTLEALRAHRRRELQKRNTP